MASSRNMGLSYSSRTLTQGVRSVPNLRWFTSNGKKKNQKKPKINIYIYTHIYIYGAVVTLHQLYSDPVLDVPTKQPPCPWLLLGCHPRSSIWPALTRALGFGPAR